jgi:hypothetical protein
MKYIIQEPGLVISTSLLLYVLYFQPNETNCIGSEMLFLSHMYHTQATLAKA